MDDLSDEEMDAIIAETLGKKRPKSEDVDSDPDAIIAETTPAETLPRSEDERAAKQAQQDTENNKILRKHIDMIEKQNKIYVPPKAGSGVLKKQGFASDKERREFYKSHNLSQMESDKRKATLDDIDYGRWLPTNPDDLPDDEFLFGTHYARRYVSETGAKTGVGKSYLAIVEALSMATGRNLFTEEIFKPLNVWYWNGEDPLYALQRKIIAACTHYSIKQDDLTDTLFVHSGRQWSIKLVEKQGYEFEVNEECYKEIILYLKRHAIDVWIVDPLIDSHSVPENDTTGMNVVVKNFGRIAEEANCAIELIHHVRKKNPNSDISSEDLRGSSTVMSGVRSLRVLNPIREADINKWDLAEDFNGFRLKTDKNNLSKRIRTQTYYELRSIPVGTKGGEKAVVVHFEPPDDNSKKKTGDEWTQEALNQTEAISVLIDGKEVMCLDRDALKATLLEINPIEEIPIDDPEKEQKEFQQRESRRLALYHGLKKLQREGKILIHKKGRKDKWIEIVQLPEAVVEETAE